MFRRSITLACTLATFVALASSASAQGVIVVQGTGETNAINAYQFLGTARLKIGRTYEVASVLATLLGAPVPAQGGVLLAQTSHTFDMGGGNTFTTLDDVRLTPVNNTGLYHLWTTATVVDGTGAYAGMTGRFRFNGTADLAIGRIVWHGHGQLR